MEHIPTNPITRLVTKYKISRIEFARRSGMSYITVNSVERGLMASMRLETARKIAEFAGENPEEIVAEYRQWKESLKTTGGAE